MPAIPALRRPRQDDGKFQASLGYAVRPSMKTTKKKQATEQCMEFHFSVKYMSTMY
jgi:hypothetical protein